MSCPGPSCKDVCEFLSDYVDGQMPVARRAAFQAHLEACPPCKEYMRQFAETIRLSKACCCPGKPQLPVPDDLIRAVCSAMGITQSGGSCCESQAQAGAKPARKPGTNP